jgi:hypothetical protein
VPARVHDVYNFASTQFISMEDISTGGGDFVWPARHCPADQAL